MTRSFELSWSDLTYDMQQSVITSCVESLLEQWEVEGKEAMNKKWYVAPKTWQEAYCRDNIIDYQMWTDLDEKGEEFQSYDWKYTLERDIEDKAENAAARGLKHTEFEVEL